jgi:hypothetical protein
MMASSIEVRRSVPSKVFPPASAVNNGVARVRNLFRRREAGDASSGDAAANTSSPAPPRSRPIVVTRPFGSNQPAVAVESTQLRASKWLAGVFVVSSGAVRARL